MHSLLVLPEERLVLRKVKFSNNQEIYRVKFYSRYIGGKAGAAGAVGGKFAKFGKKGVFKKVAGAGFNKKFGTIKTFGMAQG